MYGKTRFVCFTCGYDYYEDTKKIIMEDEMVYYEINKSNGNKEQLKNKLRPGKTSLLALQMHKLDG
jgi:hypothetical protein